MSVVQIPCLLNAERIGLLENDFCEEKQITRYVGCTRYQAQPNSQSIERIYWIDRIIERFRILVNVTRWSTHKSTAQFSSRTHFVTLVRI